MRFRRGPTTLEEVVEDVLKNMSKADKANVANTAEDNLVMFHHGWGTGIRNGYNLWQNQALVRAIGAEHPDDASMIIIKAVWQALKDSGETYRKGKIETEILTWHVNEGCLEINAGSGRSLIIDGIDLEFAEVLANQLQLLLHQTESYTLPELEPQVTLQRSATVKVWKYPGHPDNK